MGIRIGVAGNGRLGHEHVRILSALDAVEHVFCFDRDEVRCRAVASEFGATPCTSLDDLIADVDALSVVASTRAHAEIALRALDHQIDLFIEKPLAAGVSDAEQIVSRAASVGAILQVGHVERFNPALQQVSPLIKNPSFIEVHRLAPFTPRGADVSVVGDLMIHDLDLIGRFVGEWPDDIRARGASLLTDLPDIVNVRLEFPGGCVANVTASRVTVTPMRKVRIFCDRQYFSIDLLAGCAERYRPVADFDEKLCCLRAGAGAGTAVRNAPSLRDFIEIESCHDGDGEEPLQRELSAFVRCVESREAPPVSGEDGLWAVRLAGSIVDVLAGNVGS